MCEKRVEHSLGFLCSVWLKRSPGMDAHAGLFATAGALMVSGFRVLHIFPESSSGEVFSDLTPGTYTRRSGKNRKEDLVTQYFIISPPGTFKWITQALV
jgi:hypothetical protein